MKVKFAILCLMFLCLGCSTKVGNPETDNDKEPEPEKIKFEPVTLKFFEFPELDNVEADEDFKDLFRDIFALVGSSNALLGQLNEFFAIVNKNDLTVSGPIAIEEEGIALYGKSWTTEDRNGLYFCKDSKPVFYITWDEDDLHLYRDLEPVLPVSSYVMTDKLPALIEAKIDITNNSLEVNYSGRKRDPETKKDLDLHILFHYKAIQDTQTNYLGSYVETNSNFEPVTSTLRRTVGSIDTNGHGQALAHLESICGEYKAEETPPNWCAAIDFTSENIEINLEVDSNLAKDLGKYGNPDDGDLLEVSFPATECATE